MSKFYTCHNSGVTALVSDEILHNMICIEHTIQELVGKRCVYQNLKLDPEAIVSSIKKGLHHLPTTPIFTFVKVERWRNSTLFTGNEFLLKTLIDHLKHDGHTVNPAEFYVPFSNGKELGMHGVEAMTNELSYITSDRQFRETFGRDLNTLLRL